jgi:acyl carrier protein
MCRQGDDELKITDELCRYVSEELLEDDEPVAADENLLADGMVNFMGMVRLVAFIDDTWDIHVPPEDFTIENFKTVAAIDAYLSARLDDSDGR